MPAADAIDIADLYRLARACMAACYETTPPSDRYVDAGARLIIGTAATESHFRFRRQTVFDWTTDRGAWGLWQTEGGSVVDGVEQLLKRPVLARRAAQWLFQQDDAEIAPITMQSRGALLRLISGWDRLAMLFCRLHYLRVPAPIPHDLAAQAAYWKLHYNTPLGKGSVEKYIIDWNRIVSGTI
jgi:hypothetical protein